MGPAAKTRRTLLWIVLAGCGATPSGTSQFFVANADGTGATLLTEGSDPVWQPIIGAP